jgi:branched-chain amino acid transport system permease protein
MTAMTDDTLPATPRVIRDEMIAFAVMTVLLLLVPLTGLYPFFVMQGLCFALAQGAMLPPMPSRCGARRPS